MLIPALALVVSGCGRDARLAGQQLREVTVGPITKYGRVLNQSAAPQEVVYVLLQAVVDDYAAGEDHTKRDAALDTQFAVCAPEEIIRRAGGSLSQQQQLERLFAAVNHWAPTLGFYRDDFNADYETLAQRMLLVTHPERPTQADVYLNLAYPDPAASDAADAGVVARFGLVKEGGYWRIWWVGYDRRTRDWKKVPPAGTAARTPAPKPAASPAPPGATGD